MYFAKIVNRSKPESGTIYKTKENKNLLEVVAKVYSWFDNDKSGIKKWVYYYKDGKKMVYHPASQQGSREVLSCYYKYGFPKTV